MSLELSVVIPTRNRAGLLTRCLDALGAQTQPAGTFEVIVVDDGSTDGTRTLLERRTTPLSLRVEHQGWAGQAAALNAGLRAASGTYCVFLDDDIVTNRHFLEAHLRVQRAAGGVIGVGRLGLTIAPGLDWLARCHAEAWLTRYARLDDGTRELSFRDCSSGNMSAPREALDAVGGFAADLQRAFDTELAYRLECHGLRYAYVPRAFGRQVFAKRLRDVARDAERGGAAAVELHRRHPPILPKLELGGRGELGAIANRVRLALVPSRVPVTALGAAAGLLRDPAARRLWYRFVFDYAYWRGVRGAVTSRAEWEAYAGGARILMYHGVDAARTPTEDIVSARRLSRQMAWLALRGYRVISLRQLLEDRAAYRVPPPRSLVITFDDGYADVARLAHPVLARHGFSATVFLVTSHMGGMMCWDSGSALAGRPLLTWDEARRLAEAGLDFGAHTRTHARLTATPPIRLEEELRGSLTDLERDLPSSIRALAYPYGSYNQDIAAAARRAGFEAGLTVASGINFPATPPFELRRISVRGTDSFLRFAVGVWLGRRCDISADLLRGLARALGRATRLKAAAA